MKMEETESQYAKDASGQSKIEAADRWNCLASAVAHQSAF